MKDQLSLLAAGLAAAGIAWVFWHYSGEAGGLIVLILAVAALLADNRRLRKRLREREGGGVGTET